MVKITTHNTTNPNEWDCPECGDTLAAGIMVIRENKKTGKKFYGCSNFPSCKCTEPIDHSEYPDDNEYEIDDYFGDIE